MRTIHTISVVAANEFRIGKRSWVYRFMFLLTLAVTSYYHLFFQSTLRVVGFSMCGLPSSIPFMNAYLFNFLQVLLFGFLALELFARERNVGTLEVTRMRPYGNAAYLVGKYLGFFYLYLLLNGSVVLVTLLVHVLFCGATPLVTWLYLFYPVTFSLPVFVFISGFSFLAGSVSHGRVVGLLLVVGLLYACYVFGKELLPLDLFARTLPSGYSDVTGFEGMGLYTAHRLSFFFAGIGLWCLALSRMTRIPNRLSPSRRVWFLPGGMLLGCGIFLGMQLVESEREERVTRDAYRAVYAHYLPGSADLRVEQHDLCCTMDDDGRLVLQSDLLLHNAGDSLVTEVVLYLNPGLSVSAIRKEGTEIPYRREYQAIVLSMELAAGTSGRLCMEYAGGIDEQVCYLDIPDADYYQPGFVKRAYIAGRRYVYLGRDFTLLLPECLWYPVVAPPANTVAPYETVTYPTRFRFCVAGFPKDQKVISQGNQQQRGDTLVFDQVRLSGLTLCVGPFEEKSAEIDSGMLLSVYTFPHHSFGLSVEQLAQCFRHNFTRNRLPNPGERLCLVEAPFSFTTHFRAWKNGSEWVQPGILFMPEAEHFAWDPKAKLRVGGTVNNSQWMEAYLSPFFEGYSGRHFIDFVYLSTLCSDNEEYYCANKYWVGSWFPCHTIYSKEYPVLNAVWKNLYISVLANLMSGGFSSPLETAYEPNVLVDLDKGQSFRAALRDRSLSREAMDALLYLKSEELAYYLCLHDSSDQMLRFMERMQQMKAWSLEEFKREVRHYFGLDISEFLHEWYTSSQRPLYACTPLEVCKEKNTNNVYSRFCVKNTGERDGIVKVEVFLRDDFFHSTFEYVFVERGHQKEITIAGEARKVIVHTGWSQNLPNKFILEAERGKRLPVLAMEVGIKDVPLERESPREETIIVDNTDPGFRLISPPRKKLMEWFRPEKRENNSRNKWGIHLAREWSYLINEQFHGVDTRDAWYKCSGQGEFKAEWQATIREAGEYEVFVYNVKLREGTDITNTLSTTQLKYTMHYTVQSANGEEEIVFYPGKEPGGWVSLGKFNFQPGKATVILSDKGKGTNWGESTAKTNFRGFFNWNQRMRIVRMENQIIVADAVKWVRHHKR